MKSLIIKKNEYKEFELYNIIIIILTIIIIIINVKHKFRIYFSSLFISVFRFFVVVHLNVSLIRVVLVASCSI